jgi:hypothetical protein
MQEHWSLTDFPENYKWPSAKLLEKGLTNLDFQHIIKNFFEFGRCVPSATGHGSRNSKPLVVFIRPKWPIKTYQRQLGGGERRGQAT